MSFLSDFFKRLGGCREESYKQERDDLAKQNIELQADVQGFADEVANLGNRIDVLTAKMKDFGPSEFEAYLNQRFATREIVYTKRWALRDNKATPMNICDFITNWKSLPKLANLEAVGTHPIRYYYDQYAYNGIMDVWQLPLETFALAGGDCEDSAVLRASLARRIGDKNLFCALGFYKPGAHAFNLWFKDGVPYVVQETTANTFKLIEIKDWKAKIGELEYDIYYVFSENAAWQVKDGVAFGAKLAEEFGLAISD